jgi:hypothetical protein
VPVYDDHRITLLSPSKVTRCVRSNDRYILKTAVRCDIVEATLATDTAAIDLIATYHMVSTESFEGKTKQNQKPKNETAK